MTHAVGGATNKYVFHRRVSLTAVAAAAAAAAAAIINNIRETRLTARRENHPTPSAAR